MNVLLILADDLRADLLPYMPYVNGTLRRLGATYTGMRCSVPICSPARAALSSGRWAHRAENGVYVNDVTDITAPATDALGPWLQSAGVYTGMFGKYTIPGQTASPGGFDEWTCLPSGTQSAYGYVARDIAGNNVTPSPKPHQLDYLTGLVSTFVTTATGPWFCWFSPTNPHIDSTTLANNPLPPSLTRYGWLRWPFTLLTDTTNKPSWIQALAQFTGPEQGVMRQNIRQQIREARDLDASIESLCGDINFAETLLIFTSDSGVHFGEHRLGGLYCAGKSTPYEVAMRAPCVIVGPGVTAGATIDAACCLQDVTATVVEAFGATPTVTIDGDDLLGVLDPDRAILYEHTTAEPTLPAGSGVVTGTDKLIRWDATGDDEYEMYDLATDPDEHTNLANLGGAYLTTRNTLEALIDGLLV